MYHFYNSQQGKVIIIFLILIQIMLSLVLETEKVINM